MDERVTTLRSLEPWNSGRVSYLAILEAAAGLFGQFPARHIMLRDILSISGVSNQTLYNYFPNGRDDIAIVLYDRFQRTMLEDYNSNIQLINSGEARNNTAMVAQLSACLARSVFGLLSETYPLQSNLFQYLRGHNLLFMASHEAELEEAMTQAVTLHEGKRFSKADLPRIVRVSVHAVRGLADIALMNPDFPLDVLESNARKMVRALLATGLVGQDNASGSHAPLPYATGGIAILGAPIGPVKRQGIMDRILKRNRQS